MEPSLGEPGTYVLPVGEDFRASLSYVLWCRDANPLSQIAFFPEETFRALLSEEAGQSWEGMEDLRRRKEAALSRVAEAFSLEPAGPWERVRALQGAFDPACLRFSEEYYDVLGLEGPG